MALKVDDKGKKDYIEGSPEESRLRPSPGPGRDLARRLMSLSGRDALNEILDQDDPRSVVRGIARTDFYWLIRRVGEEDAFPLLSLASLEQWEHLLDMELWNKDRLVLGQTSAWLGRLEQADPGRLVRWLLSEGQALAYYYFFRSIEVEVKTGDEAYDLPGDFFTFDNIYYIRIPDRENEEIIRRILEEIAHVNYERYQALLLGLAGVLPAETEEEMYRERNLRLAEDGFLPFEEAISVYSPMKADALIRDRAGNESLITVGDGNRTLVPVTHLAYATESSLLAVTAARIADELLLDRIRLEFAGLCNQILSADGVPVNDAEVLIKACRKAAGYLNIGLEEVSRGDLGVSERVLRKNSLLHIFRVGFGLALELKWETEKWMEKAWFFRRGFPPGFWGDAWGGILLGVLEKRPRYYRGNREGEAYGDFEETDHIDSCRRVLRHLEALDSLMEILASSHPVNSGWTRDPFFTFHTLLFNYWARRQLNLVAGFEPLSLEQVRDFFRFLRADRPGPPYEMPGYGERFIEDFTAHAAGFEPEPARRLREALSLVWRKFSDEYAWVPAADLDGRYARFFLTRP
jgi:hypothetical protein